MGENNDSFLENVLLKKIDEDIPINVDLSDTPGKNPQWEHQQSQK